MHPELPPVAFLSAASVLLVLPWHWRSGNVATISLALWLFTINVIYGVGAVVWGDNVKFVIPIWCDISTKLIIGSQFALPAACLCIAIHLERVASIRAARIMPQDKRRRQIFEACMCVGLPLVFMALHYIVQGHRFDIIEEYGCRPTTYISYVGIVLMYVPPLLMAVISFVFSALALRHFLKRRVTFALHLQAANSALTTSRYLRLMSMALAQMITSIAITSYTLWFTLMAVPIRPYTSWEDVHSDWLRIDQFFTAFMPPLIVRSYYALWWVVPFSTIIFVGFFAFGKEAMDEYKKCFNWVKTTIFRQKPTSLEKTPSAKASILDKMSAKVSLPNFLGGAGNNSTSSMTTSNSSAPEGKYPPPPSPPKYFSHSQRNAMDSSSSQYTPTASPTTYVDLEANPLPPTPSSYASTSSSSSTSTVKHYLVADDLLDTPFDSSPSATTAMTHLGDNADDLPREICSTPSQLPPPPPSRPRVRPPPPSPSEPGSPRPMTYPSADAWHRSITMTFPSS